MAVERAETGIVVRTPAELAGAEEGIQELEKAMGKAKTLGQNFDGLTRQLAKAREGVRRFREEQPEGKSEDGGWRREDGEDDAGGRENGKEGMEGEGDMGEEGSEGILGAAGSGAAGAEGKVLVESGSKLPHSMGGMMVEGELQEELNQGLTAARQAAGDGEGGQGLMVGEPAEAGTPYPPETAEAGNPSAEEGGEWDARGFGRELEERLRALLEEQEVLRAAEQRRGAEQGRRAERDAAVEQRLRWVEERLRMNRE